MAEQSSVDTYAIIKRGRITDEDVLALRRAFYADGEIDRIEADHLFALNDAVTVHATSWAEFFVEAVTDALVNRMPPEGYVTAENAAWLVAKISSDGRVDSATELELLVNVLDKARWSPPSLVAFALEQVRLAVVEGEGPLRSGGRLEKGTITEGEVALLRRILYAFGGDGNAGITRAEAEVLFEINDACADGSQAPAFTDLFVKAIANALMTASGYSAPSREEALHQEAWLQSRGDVYANFGKLSFGSILSAFRAQSREEAAIARLDRQRMELITGEEITENEANWLADRLGRDGRITPNEQALLTFLEAECPAIHPVLQQRVAALSRAA